MSECRRVQENLVAFLCGELDEKEREKVERHLRLCPHCRRELTLLQETLKGADSLAPDLEMALASVDWEAMSEKIAGAVRGKETQPRELSWGERFRLSFPQLKPVFAGVLVGVMVGALATWVVFRGRFVERNGGEKFFASGEFLDRVDVEVARRETLDYLEKSQYVLLEFAQPTAEAGKFRLSDAATLKTKELLSKKKFLNTQLAKTQMAKAKEICDQIELLFYELSLVSESLTEQQRQEIQRLIEEKNLLLKIKLLRKELQESEV